MVHEDLDFAAAGTDMTYAIPLACTVDYDSRFHSCVTARHQELKKMKKEG
jgi:hypothetical protein